MVIIFNCLNMFLILKKKTSSQLVVHHGVYSQCRMLKNKQIQILEIFNNHISTLNITIIVKHTNWVKHPHL